MEKLLWSEVGDFTDAVLVIGYCLVSILWLRSYKRLEDASFIHTAMAILASLAIYAGVVVAFAAALGIGSPLPKGLPYVCSGLANWVLVTICVGIARDAKIFAQIFISAIVFIIVGAILGHFYANFGLNAIKELAYHSVLLIFASSAFLTMDKSFTEDYERDAYVKTRALLGCYLTFFTADLIIALNDLGNEDLFIILRRTGEFCGFAGLLAIWKPTADKVHAIPQSVHI